MRAVDGKMFSLVPADIYSPLVRLAGAMRSTGGQQNVSGVDRPEVIETADDAVPLRSERTRRPFGRGRRR